MMETVLVDTNVIIDYLDEESEWFDWSATMLSDVGDRAIVAINAVVYAEVAVAYSRIEDVEAALPEPFFVRLHLPWAAAFLAGQVFKQYRRRGGKRTGVLPDFFIGAHAVVAGLTLLTRDARRYRQYFPKIRLIAP
jgi:predicted nucleic acid-binding protein